MPALIEIFGDDSQRLMKNQQLVTKTCQGKKEGGKVDPALIAPNKLNTY